MLPPGGLAVGCANWAPRRPGDGRRHAVEDFVYLASGHQGRGLGADVLTALGRGAGQSRPSR